MKINLSKEDYKKTIQLLDTKEINISIAELLFSSYSLEKYSESKQYFKYLLDVAVEDVRRLLKRFEKDVVLFSGNPAKMDKDLLIIQERLKKINQGILRVIRVEGTDDGATVIHMTVD